MRRIEDFVRDLRYAVRTLRRNPGFAAVVIASLAVGIGANTAIFTIVDALMFKTLPVRDPERLVMAWTHNGPPIVHEHDSTFSHPIFVRFRGATPMFTSVAAIWTIERSNVSVAQEAEPEITRVGLASGDYFRTLGVEAAIGRTIGPDDDRVERGHPIAVISDAFWTRRFGRAPDVVSRSFVLNDRRYDIIGVTPPAFAGEWIGKPTDVWVPFMMADQVMPEVPGVRNYPTRVIARLKPGVTMQQAEAASQPLYHQLLEEQAGPSASREQLDLLARWRFELESGARGHSPQRALFAQPLAILMTMVGLVLLVACANVANLLLARASARRREIAVSVAIGAARGRIIRQMLAESLVIAAAGGAVGVLFAFWSANALAAGVAAAPVSMGALTSGASLTLTPNVRSLVFALGLSILTAIVFGLAPAWRGSSVPLAPALTDRSGTSHGSTRRFGVRHALVIAQVAASLLLLVGAGLFVRTLRNLERQDLGFDREHVLFAWTVPGQTGRQGPEMAAFWRRIQERLQTIPGVVSAGGSNTGVLTGAVLGPRRPSQPMFVDGEPPKSTDMPALRLFVTPRFFETMGISLVAGREFTERDADPAPRVVILSEAMARFYFGRENPIGRHVRFPGTDQRSTEVVGVIRDYAKGTPRAPGGNEFNTYFPYRDREGVNAGFQTRLRVMLIAVRTAGDPRAVAARIRTELRAIDPALPVLKIDTVDEQLSDVLARDRLIARLSMLFGAVAVGLACLGVYGVVSYAVVRRTHEIGIRLALGATRRRVVTMVLGDGFVLVFGGVAVGLLATLAGTRLIANRLFGVSASDPLTVVTSIVLLVVVASIAGLVPAHRASRVDPMVALRSE